MLGVGLLVSQRAIFILVVPVAHKFTADPSTVCDYGCRAYGELARLTYCLLQKIEAPYPLLLIEKWEKYMLPNHLRFPTIEEIEFLTGSWFNVAPDKVGNCYLPNEFQKDAQNVLEELSAPSYPQLQRGQILGKG